MLVVIPKFAVQRLHHRHGIKVAAVIVAVKNSVHLLEGARLDVLMLVSELKQFLGVLHHLNGGGAELTGTHLDIGRVQAVGLPDLAEIIRLGLAALRDDQDAVIAGASRQL